MALKKYLEGVGGTKTFYRIQEKYENKLLLHQLAKTKNKAKLVEDIRKAIFVKQPKGIYVFISDKSWHTQYGTNYKIASIVTSSLDKTKGKREFEKELKNSAKIRKNNWLYINKELKPFFKKIIKSNLVDGIIVRGDLVDPKRFPCKYSDIDLILLTNFESGDKTAKNKLFKLLRKSPGRVYYNYYFFKQEHFSSNEKPLIRRKANFAVGYGIISLSDFKMLYKIWRDKKKKARKYDVENLSKAKIMFEKNHAAKEFLRLILSLK